MAPGPRIQHLPLAQHESRQRQQEDLDLKIDHVH